MGITNKSNYTYLLDKFGPKFNVQYNKLNKKYNKTLYVGINFAAAVRMQMQLKSASVQVWH